MANTPSNFNSQGQDNRTGYGTDRYGNPLDANGNPTGDPSNPDYQKYLASLGPSGGSVNSGANLGRDANGNPLNRATFSDLAKLPTGYTQYTPEANTVQGYNAAQAGAAQIDPGFMQYLRSAMLGNAPSAAQAQLTAGSDQAARNAGALVAGGRGNQANGANIQAALQAQAMGGQQAANQAAQLRAQETQAAAGAYGNAATNQASLNQGANLANAGAMNQAKQYNSGLGENQYEFGQNIGFNSQGAQNAALMGQAYQGAQFGQDNTKAAINGGVAAGSALLSNIMKGDGDSGVKAPVRALVGEQGPELILRGRAGKKESKEPLDYQAVPTGASYPKAYGDGGTVSMGPITGDQIPGQDGAGDAMGSIGKFAGALLPLLALGDGGQVVTQPTVMDLKEGDKVVPLTKHPGGPVQIDHAKYAQSFASHLASKAQPPSPAQPTFGSELLALIGKHAGIR